MQADQLTQSERIAVRLFRRWAISRESGINPIVALHEVADVLRFPVETAVACASLFELVEGLLGRSLVRECCCSRACSADELALIGLLRCAPDLRLDRRLGTATLAIPHGLPGAVCWAAMAVRRALGLSPRQVSQVGHCPFDPPQSSLAA